ncbi:MAG: polysaccharide biosynthesis C-terminal domain-containing protein, partial [Bacteroidales bacterium]
AILLYAFDVLNLNGFVVATIFAYGITALVDLFYISRIGKLSLQHDLKKDIPRPLRKDITTYSLFFILALIGNLLSMKLDIFMVSAKMGLAYTGIYSVAYFMAAIIEMPSRSISTISLPLVSEAFKNKDYDRASYYYKRVSLNQFLAGCTIFVFLWINMDNIYQIMPNGDVYIQGMYVVLFISMAKLLDMMANFGGSILNVSKYYRYSVPFVLLLAVLTVVSNNIFIPIFGISGAALATLISVGIYNSLIVTFIAWKMKIHPFTWSLLKVVILMGILLGLNQCISPLENPVEDAFLRSSL